MIAVMWCGPLALAAVLSVTQGALASPVSSEPKKEKLSERLSTIHSKVMSLEQELIGSLQAQKQARTNIKKIQHLMELQREEKELGAKRLAELERTIHELESRRKVLRERVLVQQRAIHKALTDLNRSMRESPSSTHLPAQERLEAPKRKVLANIAERSVREIEALKADLVDADQLETRIQEEKHQLAYLVQEIREQEGILELNKQLQVDLLRKNHAERVAQLDNYRKLKSAEAQVEGLIQDFNARLELERVVETERIASKAMMQGEFSKLRGSLPLPVTGRVVSSFGRGFDPKSKLYIFKKGVDIAAIQGGVQPVRAVSAGKVAFSGELPNYGKVTIIDHGGHFYTLCAHLGELLKKTADSVAAGDSIGMTESSGTPVYFEIRARNIAVNPLQWVSN